MKSMSRGLGVVEIGRGANLDPEHKDSVEVRVSSFKLKLGPLDI